MKRLTALVICFVMIFAAFPFGAVAETEEYGEIIIIPDFDFPDNDELFAGYVEKAFYPEMAFATWGRSARDQLSDNDKYMYDWLKSNIVSIANGVEASSRFYAESSLIGTWTNITKSFTSDHINQFFAQFDHQNIMEALLQDCPYELYWFDKASGYRLGASRTGNNITRVMAIMSVSVGYRADNYDEDYPEVSVGTTVATAISNAQSVVNKYAALGDYEKLSAYRDEICSLTDYNYDILEVADPDYGDPWQLIHVFDGDASTKVVCEGYSKAFKYLCDKSTFASPNISCYSVVGTSNGGGHMWNIVTLADGKNYMADITNSDSGAIGQNGGLFLSGMSGSVSAGYTKSFYKTMTYLYSDDTKLLWGTDSESILNLSETDFNPYFPTITVSVGELVYDGEMVTAGKSNADIIYSIQSQSGSADYSVTVEWHKDNNGSIGVKTAYAPTNAGAHWVKITATHTNGATNSVTKQFTIAPAKLNIVSAECESKEYDGTANTILKSISVTGIYGSDYVWVSGDASFLSASVGEKNQVRITNIVLSGDEASNYVPGNSEYIVSIPPVSIVKASGGAAPEASGSYAQDPVNTDTFVYTLSLVEGAEYRMDDGEWQDGNSFSGIAPGSTHIFYLRIKGNENTAASEIGETGEVFFDKLEQTEIPFIQAEVSGNMGNRTITIFGDENMEFSFDNGLTWTDNNVLTGITADKVECMARFKETATMKASQPTVLQVNTLKESQAAPQIFEIVFTLNPDGETYTATIPFIENGLYSFDGVSFSDNNQKTDCLPETEIKAYVKFAETDELGESIATVVTAVVPVINNDYLKGDINENGVIDSMDYVLLKRAYFGTYKLKNIAVGDINSKDGIDSMDYVLLKRAYFGTYVIK